MLSTVSAPPRPYPNGLYPNLSLPKLELCFRDGQRIWLHACGLDQLSRSIDVDGESLQIDLCALCPGLADDYLQAHATDKPAIIFFSLRLRYPTLGAFLAAVSQIREFANATNAGAIQHG